MRLAVLSDIHGNLIALETVLADMEAAGGADKIWLLGDVAAFGPRPAECIRRVQTLQAAAGEDGFAAISGNTDRYLVNGTRPATPPPQDEAAFMTLAAAWSARDDRLNWALSRLTFEDYTGLKNLKQELSLVAEGYGPAIGYHAIPGDDEALLTAETPEEEALDMLLDREGRLGIGGHIHRQMDRDLGRWRVVNVGSIGLSFDRPGRAQWGLFTFENGVVTVDLRAVEYDVEAVIRDLQTCGMPAPGWVINTLRSGA